MGTVLAIVAIEIAVIVIVVVVIQRGELLCVDGPDGPPFACRTRHHLHHRRERSVTELMRQVVERVDVRQPELDWDEGTVDKPVVICRKR